MKIYLAGKITGNHNYKEQFERKQKELEAQGHIVINPVKPEGFDYKEYIDMGLSELKYCDAIYLMNGWKESEGARLEFIYAFTVGIGILEEEKGK
ncbi:MULTISPECIES: DUF4406 domain-containing protein [Bacillota]|uniref:DUF4406 domain-containing protein n=1 Tax=Bacillota TaxID=1239 RepID=UPI000E41BACA|nr:MULTISPECIES: DUF4406 domain-containing protein [Bacillota]RGB58573.1 DUF4406 domain-containing protein [Absiella sp. AM22-9]